MRLSPLAISRKDEIPFTCRCVVGLRDRIAVVQAVSIELGVHKDRFGIPAGIEAERPVMGVSIVGEAPDLVNEVS